MKTTGFGRKRCKELLSNQNSLFQECSSIKVGTEPELLLTEANTPCESPIKGLFVFSDFSPKQTSGKLSFLFLDLPIFRFSDHFRTLFSKLSELGGDTPKALPASRRFFTEPMSSLFSIKKQLLLQPTQVEAGSWGSKKGLMGWILRLYPPSSSL